MDTAKYEITDVEFAARDALIAEIEAAFDGVSREDGVTLHEAIIIDEYGSDSERATARAQDIDTHWQNVPARDIEEDGIVTLTFVDAKGFCYYIPAFMIWTLRNFRNSGSVVSDFTICTFTHDAVTVGEQFVLLTDRQRRAIGLFLRFFEKFDPEGNRVNTYQATIALRFGWSDYLMADD